MAEQNPNVSAAQGSTPIGGRDPKRPGRDFKVFVNDFSQAYQSEPLPLCYGTVRRAGTYIMPVWAMRTKKITTKVGK